VNRRIHIARLLAEVVGDYKSKISRKEVLTWLRRACDHVTTIVKTEMLASLRGRGYSHEQNRCEVRSNAPDLQSKIVENGLATMLRP